MCCDDGLQVMSEGIWNRHSGVIWRQMKLMRAGNHSVYLCLNRDKIHQDAPCNAAETLDYTESHGFDVLHGASADLFICIASSLSLRFR